MNIEKNKNKKILFFSHGISMLFGIALGMAVALLFVVKSIAVDTSLIKAVALSIAVLVVIAICARGYTLYLWKCRD